MVQLKNMKMMQPQEIETWYILPAIRKELAAAMKNIGMNQKKIAKTLGLTEAAVSQYVNKKRGQDCKIDLNLREEFRRSAENLQKNGELIFAEIQRLLNLLRKNGAVCRMHAKKSAIPKGCEVCLR